MARNRTLLDIRTEVYDRSDVEEVYCPTDEMDRMINSSLARLYRAMVRASKDWFLSSTDVSVVAGTGNYALASDTWRAQKVLVYDSGEWYPMRRWGLSEICSAQETYGEPRNSGYRVMNKRLYIFPTDFSWSGTVRVWYTPAPPQLSADTDTWDGVAGWEEFVVVECCIKLAVKQEQDAGELFAERKMLLEEIVGDAAETDDGEPGRVRDVALEKLGLDIVDYLE